MAQHPSLRSQEKGKQHRSVLKRFERIKELKAKEKWNDGDSVFGLPKLKIIRFKLKKEKAAPAAAEGAEVLEGAAVAAEGAAPAGAKETKGAAKAAPAKKEAPKKEEGKGKKK